MNTNIRVKLSKQENQQGGRFCLLSGVVALEMMFLQYSYAHSLDVAQELENNVSIMIAQIEIMTFC